MPRDDYAQRRPPIPREEIRGEGGMRPSGDLRGEPRRGGAGGIDPDPYDSAPNSARSSAYTDADDDSSLADFESGAEDLTDDGVELDQVTPEVETDIDLDLDQVTPEVETDVDSDPDLTLDPDTPEYQDPYI